MTTRCAPSWCAQRASLTHACAQEEYLNGWLKGWLKKHSHDAEYVDVSNSQLVDIALKQVPAGAARGWFVDAGY